MDNINKKNKTGILTAINAYTELYDSLEAQFKQIMNENRLMHENLKKIDAGALWIVHAPTQEILFQNPLAETIGIDPKDFIDTGTRGIEIELDGKWYFVISTTTDTQTFIRATDTTEAKRNERLTSMGKMAAHLAHELRNPIGSISIMASTLFENADLKSKSVILEIKRVIWRIERIIKATLLFSKGVSADIGPYDTVAIVMDINSALQNYPKTKDIEIKIDLPSQIIKADGDLLAMVFQNLVINAVDAIEECDDETGEINIALEKFSDHVIITVLDSGKGFENAQTIFEAFNTTKTTGHGLGLALSQQIIASHKGEIYPMLEPKGMAVKLYI